MGLGSDQVRQVKQPSTMLMTGQLNIKGDTLPTLITGSVKPVLVYKNRPAPIQSTNHTHHWEAFQLSQTVFSQVHPPQ